MNSKLKNKLSALKINVYQLDLNTKIGTIPTPSILLNTALNGGFPNGKMVFLNGQEASGKSTFMWQMIALNQHLDPDFTALIIDAEHAFNSAYVKSLGVDLDRIEVWVSNDLEDIFKLINLACHDVDTFTDANSSKNTIKKNFNLILVDSIEAMMPTEDINNDDISDARMGLKAKQLSNGFKTILSPLHKSDSCLVFINQYRENIGGYGSPISIPGGKAKEYYAYLRLDIKTLNQVKDDSGVTGRDVNIHIFKNKNGISKKDFNFRLNISSGFDFSKEILEVGLDTGVIVKAGAWYSFNYVSDSGETKTEKFQGENRLLEFLDAHEFAIEYIKDVYNEKHKQ